MCSYGRLTGTTDSQRDSSHDLELSESLIDYNTVIGNDLFALEAFQQSSFPLDSVQDHQHEFVFAGISNFPEDEISSTDCERESFEFLLNFTTCSGLNDTFNFRTSDERRQNSILGISFLPVHDLEPASSHESHSVRKQSSDKSTRTIGISLMIEWISHPLFPQAKQIWEAMRASKLAAQKFVQAADVPSGPEELYMEIFSPPNLQSFLDLFWTRWYSNCPFLHKPSFDISKAPMEMVLALCLTGAFMSSDQSDLANARHCLDTAESIIFRHPWISKQTRDSTETDHALPSRSKLKLLQSALLICVLQNWEGTNLSRQRIMQRRYASVVFVSARHHLIGNELC